MKRIDLLKCFIACVMLMDVVSVGYAENIDPYDDDSQYAYGENVGWLNFEPGEGPGVTVSKTQLTGYVWAENVGWINLSPASYGGVLNDGSGNLSGYAWGENVGWINFKSADLYGYNVSACKVSLEDLSNFIDDWLASGAGIPGDLSGNEEVDFEDYSILADFWRDYCPDAWPLK